MVQFSPKVKEKNAEKWCRALAPDLLDGEVIWALVSASRIKPVTSGVAITNGRIIGFWHSAPTTDKRILLEVWADQIRDIGFPIKAGSTSLRVMTENGEVNFGTLHKDEVDFTRHFVDHLRRSGLDPAISAALAQQSALVAQEQSADRCRRHERDGVPVFGGAMKEKWWADVSRHAHADELPWFVINAGTAGRLVAFDDRLLILKTGGMTGFMAGSLGGGRETTFPYSDITNIEYNSGMVNGVLEVLTPSYQGSGNHDYWRSSNKSRNRAADDPWTLSNCLPLAKPTYREAQPMLNELQRKIADTKRTPLVIQHTPAPAPSAGTGLADELSKLADMHHRGLLTDDEFTAAKQAAITRLS
ncbi:SHOCT domain-containing protein [Gordonia shandongensis]|uniref:SHOCT domain-containing protein n=1 Tax=Gordonia shandongensis TaxID=376351 RepID=UPI00040E4ACD|nr:SHOCT domain-containing protein [Gordonia shandongensis]